MVQLERIERTLQFAGRRPHAERPLQIVEIGDGGRGEQRRA